MSEGRYTIKEHEGRIQIWDNEENQWVKNDVGGVLSYIYRSAAQRWIDRRKPIILRGS